MMEIMGLPNEALINYIYPNNAHVFWSVLIVIYPFITGLVAGAFVVSALHHVFKMKEFEPIANFALVSAFCFGCFAAVPLLFHLGQPQRALEIYITPHTTSAMSIFGYVYSSYMILLMIEIWFVYRPYFIRRANDTNGFMGLVWKVLTLGVRQYVPGSARLDHKVVVFLAGIGIPWAFILHGYVGFVFGSVKAISWWATALQPIIFLSSAIVSGVAILQLMYSFIKWRRKEPCDLNMIKKMMAILWAVFLIDWALEMLELIHVYYRQDHEWDSIGPLIMGPLYGSYIWGQVIILSFIPTLILGYVVLSRNRGKLMFYLANLASLMLLLQVLVMRFNVVVGGQLVSKSARGFVDYHWEFIGKEGLLTSALIFSGPFILYFIINRFIPIFGDPATANPGEKS